MLTSSDSRRRQPRVPVNHASGGTGPSRFQVDSVARSPLMQSSQPQQPYDVQSGRGCFTTVMAKLRIRNLFFVIIGCASALLVGWVNISTHNVIPMSTIEMDQHPGNAKATKETGSSKVEKNSRNLSSKRFSTLGAPSGDNSLLEIPQTKLKRARAKTNVDTLEQSEQPRQESDSTNLRRSPVDEQVEDLRQQPESFRSWKKKKTSPVSDLQQQPGHRQRQLPNDNQRQPGWQSTEEANLQPPTENEQEPLYSQPQKQDGIYKRRKSRRSYPMSPDTDQLQSERNEGNEGLNPMSSQEDIEDDPQHPKQRQTGGRQAAKGRNIRFKSSQEVLEDTEVPRQRSRKQFTTRTEPPDDPQEVQSEEEPLQEQDEEESPKRKVRKGPYVSPKEPVESSEPNQLLPGRAGTLKNNEVQPATAGEFTSSQTLTCPTLDQSHVDRIIYWKEPKDSDYEVVSSYRQAGGQEAKYLTFELNTTSIQWNSRRRLLETMVALAFATGRTLVLPPKMTLVTTIDEMSKAGMSPWLGFQDLMTLPSSRFHGVSVISMDRFLEREGTTGRLKTTQDKNGKAGTPLSPPNGYAHWDGAANMQDLWQYIRSVSRQPEGWDPLTCVLGIPSAVRKSSANVQGENGEDIVQEVATVDTSSLMTWMENIWGRHHGRPPPDRLDYQGRPTRVDAPAVERLRELAAERKTICQYGQELQQSKVLHLQGDQLEGYPFYSFVFFEDWKQDLFVKRMVRDQVRYKKDIVCAAAKVVDHLEAADGNVPAHFHGMHLRLRDLIKGDGNQFEEDDLNVAMSLLVEDLKKWIQPGSRLYIATDMDQKRDCFQILRQSYHLVFISYIESLLEGRIKPVFYPMVEQLVLARAHTFVGSYPSAFSAYVNRLRGYYTTTAKQKSAKVDFLQQLAGAQDGSLASYYLAPRQMQKQMRVYQSLRQPLGDLEYPVAWRDVDRD